MLHHNRMYRWLFALLFCLPLLSNAAQPVKSMVVFGDSMSDTGNTTHLLKSLRQDESPAYLVAPFKAFVLNKMIDFANDYYVPQMVLDTGIVMVTEFFDYELAPYLSNLIARIRLVPILPGKPYWKDRFSNGLVWNEYLAQMWSIQKDDSDVYINKAFGGSWAATYDYELTVWNLIRHPIGSIKSLIVGKLVPPSLGFVVQAHIMERSRLDVDAVYFINYGANDYLNVLFFEDKYNPEVMSRYIDNVLDGIDSSVVRLLKSGARRFVVLGVPHVGNMPKHVKTTDKEVLNAAVDQHNLRLSERIEAWKLLYPQVDFLYVDTDRYLKATLSNPGKYGFTHLTDSCIDVEYPMFNGLANSPYSNNYALHYTQVLQYQDKQFARGQTNYHVCDAPESYLFWDDVHFTTRAHAFLALEVCETMKAHGYEVDCKLPQTIKNGFNQVMLIE